jgi:putative flippase GtrA
MDLTNRLKRNNPATIILCKVINLEFGKFVIVGILNTTINYGVFVLLFSTLNFLYFVAGAFGFVSGAVPGFFLNRLWTFKSDVPIAAGFLKYFIIQLFCLGAHITTQICVTEILGVPEIFSQLAGITVTTFLNFFISRAIVFNINKKVI